MMNGAIQCLNSGLVVSLITPSVCISTPSLLGAYEASRDMVSVSHTDANHETAR